MPSPKSQCTIQNHHRLIRTRLRSSGPDIVLAAACFAATSPLRVSRGLATRSPHRIRSCHPMSRLPFPTSSHPSTSLHRPSEMRQTLRRACAACARTKHSCDLGTPRCSRCTKRKVQCVYANEPLRASASSSPPAQTGLAHARGPLLPNYYGLASFDPFDTYPSTRLPRQQVERLIHSCKYLVFSARHRPWAHSRAFDSSQRDRLPVLPP